MPAGSAEARMEIGRLHLCGAHRERMRPKMRIDRPAHHVRIPVALEIEMSALALGMDAGIRASGAMDGRTFAAEGAGRRLDRRLHAWAIGLRLPADERPAIIFDDEAIARHGSGEHRAGRDREAAEQLLAAHDSLALALNFQRP